MVEGPRDHPVTPQVVIAGAGFAGLSAGVRLAAAGVCVLVAEERPRLGGRATAFTDRETNERVDNGQHVLFGCYRETYAFLETIGTAALAPLQPTLTLLMSGRDGTYPFECPDLPAPLQLAVGLLRWQAIGWSDRVAALRLGRILLKARHRGAATVASDVPPSLTVSGWLRQHGQTARLEHWLWNPLAIAGLNQAPDRAAARPFVRVLGELFGAGRSDASVGLPAVALDDLYAAPAKRFIESRGGAVIERARVRVRQADNGFEVALPGRNVTVAAVISAVPWFDLGRLWDPEVPVPLAATMARAQQMTSSPIVTVNLWLDGDVRCPPFVGLVDGPMHWAFNKAALLDDSATRHIAMVASGADDLLRLDNESLTRVASDQLSTALGLRQVPLARAVVVREPRATFSVAPDAPPRPREHTPLPGFFLAGDWIDTGLPGTIESAVLSGHRAARAALAYLRQQPTSQRGTIMS